MPIFEGDFFKDRPSWRATDFPGKMPFEDRVREYIAAHPGHTIEQCSSDLGISPAAVAVACESLVSKGAANWED